MNDRTKFWKSLTAITGVVALLMLCSLATADDSDDEDSDPQVAEISTPLDTAYAQIQAGFLGLEPIWKKACYDCHSDKTVYPWYHSLPLIKGLIDSDIREARGELDMSAGFPFLSTREPVDDLHKIKQEVIEGAMPPWNYRLMHWDAKLTDAEKQSISEWIDNSLSILAAHGIQSTRFKQGEPESH